MQKVSLPKRSSVFAAFPDIQFEPGAQLSWNPRKNVVAYPGDVDFDLSIFYGVMHEIAHAQLAHRTFTHDIELLKMERDAWDLAKKLAKKHFSIALKDTYAEDCLDSYRDWLYLRSKCPKCQLVGFQVALDAYSCPHCLIDWKVSKSRLCTVRRRVLPKQ